MKILVKDKTFYLDFFHVGCNTQIGPELVNIGLKREQLERYTEAIITDSEGVTVSIGTAHCHPNDTFDKKKGRKIALIKCLEDAPIMMVYGPHGGMLTFKECRRIRGLVWQQYLKRAKV